MFSLSFPAAVQKVYDGDTIEVEVRRTIRVRILGLWCPEVRTRDAAEKAAGLAARDALRELIGPRLTGSRRANQVVVTVPIEADGRFGDSMSFGRVLGKVKTSDGIDVAEWMISRGHGTRERS